MNRLLLVDDEKVFLKSLKTGLKEFESQFSTDICFSASEAIKKIEKRSYDLIITDIRMPNKSGIDLILYLKEINFPGGIKVMSAHNTDENIEQINSLGVVDVISKPIELEWFQNMVADFFNRAESVNFESIDILSVMQVINIDRKSSALLVQSGDEKGHLYFKDGELINAEFGEIKGEEAVFQLLHLKNSSLSVKKLKKTISREIDTPFVELMMNLMKKKDEFDREDKTKDLLKHKKQNKEDSMEGGTADLFKSAMDSLSEASGFKACGIYNSSGDVLAHKDTGDFNFESIGSIAIELYISAKSIGDKMGIGECNFVEIHTSEYVFIHMCVVPGKGAMGMLLAKSGNLGLARHQMKKVGKLLMPEFE